jgi:hypothetical protein
VDETVSLTTHDQGGNRDGGEKRANIVFQVGPDQVGGLIMTTAAS